MKGTDYQHEVEEENASKFLDWIHKRGGVAIWESQDFSGTNSFSTPAITDGEPTKRPSYLVGEKPNKVITDPKEIEVVFYKEVKRFHVAVRIGSQGLKVKVTDGGTRRIRAAVAKAGPKATYTFDYSTQEAVILVPESKGALADWRPTITEEFHDRE